MRRTSQRRTPQFLWIARFILRFGKTIAKAFTYLMLEFTLYIAIGGLAIALLYTDWYSIFPQAPNLLAVNCTLCHCHSDQAKEVGTCGKEAALEIRILYRLCSLTAKLTGKR